MSRAKLDLDRIHVAAPCSADWELMEGGDKVRYCRQCDKNVYNLSNMSRPEATKLIADSETKVCAKLYRRADGTVLTADCPVGLRTLRRRVSRFASAALSAILSFMPGSLSYGAQANKELKADGGTYTISRKIAVGEAHQAKPAFLDGRIYDINKAVVPSARVTLTNKRTKEVRTVETNEEGIYRFSSVEAGTYTITVESPGFRKFRQRNLSLQPNEQVKLDATLDVGPPAELGVVITIDRHQ